MHTSLPKRLRDDSGIALPVVLGVIAVLTALAVGAYAIASQSITDTRRTDDATQAFQAASAGVDVALTRIQVNGFNPGDYPLAGVTSVGASYTASIEATTNSEFVCTATGTSRAGSETIKVKFFYLNLWNMNLANGTDDSLGGGVVRGTTSVYGPFYVRGGVELNSNSTVEQGPFFIRGGDLTLTGSGGVGGVTPIDVYVTGAAPPLGSHNFNVRTLSHSVPDIALPAITDEFMQEKAGISRSESVDNVQGDSVDPPPPANLECSAVDPATYQTVAPPNNPPTWTRAKAPGASSWYKYVGDPATVAPLGQGTHGLTIGGTGSWGSGSGDGHYTLTSHDDFMYDDTANILTVDGTVFVDGPLTINENMFYQGNGTIVCNGPITINGSFKPYNTPNNYMDATHVVGLVTPSTISVTAASNNLGKDPTANPDLCGAFFASKDFSMDGNWLVKGSVLAGGIDFMHSNEHLVTDPNLPSFLPKSLPGNGACILTKGAWVR